MMNASYEQLCWWMLTAFCFPAKSPTVQRCGWWCLSCAWPSWLWPSSFLSSSALWATTAVSRPARVSGLSCLCLCFSVWPTGQSIAVAGQTSKHVFFCCFFSLYYDVELAFPTLSLICDAPLGVFNLLLWIISSERGEEEIISTVSWTVSKYSRYWSSHLLFTSIVFTHVTFRMPGASVQYPTRLASFAALYIIFPLCHPPIYPSHSLSSLTFLPPRLLLYKGRSVWAFWMVICTTEFNYL